MGASRIRPLHGLNNARTSSVKRSYLGGDFRFEELDCVCRGSSSSQEANTIQEEELGPPYCLARGELEIKEHL